MKKLPPGSVVGPKVRLPGGPEAPSARLTLPWPPSMNHYWRHVVIRGQSRTLLSAKGRDYRLAVAGVINRERTPMVRGRLRVELECHPPDRRARDLDNLPKGILDALKHCAVIVDDALIDELFVWRAGVEGDGYVVVTVAAVA